MDLFKEFNMKLSSLLVTIIVLTSSSAFANKQTTFTKQTLTTQYHSEGANYADIDQDGNLDIIYGPYWFKGPTFKQKFTYYLPKKLNVKQYAMDHFATFSGDFNNDGFPDILTIGVPGERAVWYQNPGKNNVKSNKKWKLHLIFKNIDNESPMFEDIDGDGNKEILCQSKGQFGYVKPDPSSHTKIWKFHAISSKTSRGRYTHGLGLGDINNDGRLDLLEKNGWYEQPENNNKLWKFHPHNFTRHNRGGAQMYAYDVDGDGDKDIITSLEAHAYGLAWFEQIKVNGKIKFKQHIIIDSKKEHSNSGLILSQMHGLNLIDIDNDGLKDIVTGKRYFAHNGNDPGAHMPLITVWFKLTRKNGKVEFIPNIIADKCGVGVQVEVADLNNDTRPEIIIGNKSGVHILWQNKK